MAFLASEWVGEGLDSLSTNKAGKRQADEQRSASVTHLKSKHSDRTTWIPLGYPAANLKVSCRTKLVRTNIKKKKKQKRRHEYLDGCSHLEDGDDGPEKGVKVLPVWQRVSIPLRAKFATKQMHPKNTEMMKNKK